MCRCPTHMSRGCGFLGERIVALTGVSMNGGPSCRDGVVKGIEMVNWIWGDVLGVREWFDLKGVMIARSG